jgi:hypothetical protein
LTATTKGEPKRVTSASLTDALLSASLTFPVALLLAVVKMPYQKSTSPFGLWNLPFMFFHPPVLISRDLEHTPLPACVCGIQPQQPPCCSNSRSVEVGRSLAAVPFLPPLRMLLPINADVSPHRWSRKPHRRATLLSARINSRVRAAPPLSIF